MYPMLTPKEIFDDIGKSQYFSILDLRQGFNQIQLKAKDRKKTAFHGSAQLWEWLVMPFGLKNVSIFFQCVMDRVLYGADHLKYYIDDILMHINTFEEHLYYL